MKKIVHILAMSLMVFLLTACKTNDSENSIVNDLGPESELGNNINELEDVTLRLNKSSYSPEGDTFEVEVENNSDEEVSFGVEYILEFYDDDAWYQVKSDTEPGFVLLLVTLPPGEKNTDEVNLEFYEPLETGKYRLIRNIGEDPMAAEFEVKN